MLVSIEETGKNQLQPSEESRGDAAVLSYYSLLRNFLPKPTSALEQCREGEPILGCPFFVAFPSTYIPKSAKDFSVHFCIHSGNLCKFSQRIPGSFWSYHLY